MDGRDNTTAGENDKLKQGGLTQEKRTEGVPVDLPTEQDYDPLQQHKPSELWFALDRISALEEAIRTCWDLLDLIYSCLLRSPIFGNSLEQDSYQCPRCEGKLKYDEEKATHICKDCGHIYSLWDNWCYRCLSQSVMNYIKETDDLICPKCGAKRYSR